MRCRRVNAARHHLLNHECLLLPFMKKSLLSIVICSLLPVAEAWQDDALATLAAKAGDAEAKPLQVYVDERDKSFAEFKADHAMFAGYDLWKQEVPELLRRVAETGDASLQSPHGFTALQAACLVGDAALIEALVAQGAAVNARPAEWDSMPVMGNPPLALLMYNTTLSLEERLRLGRLLLDHGAEPDVFTYGSRFFPGYQGDKSILFNNLSTWNVNDWPLCMLLLEYGEQNLNKRFGNNGLRIWICGMLSRSFLRAALERGVPPHGFIAEKNLTVIQVAVTMSDPDLVKLVLEKGYPPKGPKHNYHDQAIFIIPTWNNPYRNEEEVQLEATPERAVEIARLLLEHGADINALDMNGDGLRIHYGKKKGPIAEALCAYFKSRGAVLHPDAKSSKKTKK